MRHRRDRQSETATATGELRALPGFHAVEARLARDAASVDVVYVDPQRRDGRMRRLLEKVQRARVRCEEVPAQRLDALARDSPHQGVVAMAQPREGVVTLEDIVARVHPGTLLLLLDGVTDPRNLGACIRTAAAAGADALIVPRDRSASLTPQAAKAAAGAAEIVPLVVVTNLSRAMQELQEAGVWIVGADGQAPDTLFQLELKGALAWVLGAEGSGLRRLTRDRCDALARIPIEEGIESLNVSVASGICLFETLRQRGATAPPSP
jgi:23S rRNA (guanosine2251-2'-O)-methyltransferase